MNRTTPFEDRVEAGRILAEALAKYGGRPDVVVFGLPRGGIPVAYEVALALEAPLDVLPVRKLGVPGHEELAMGAVASGGAVVINDEVIESMRIPSYEIEEAEERQQRELKRRETLYRNDRPPLNVRNKTVILVDDGLATGATMKAAVAAVRMRHPARVVVAVPVGSYSTYMELSEVADECICVMTPEPFQAVGMWYHDFTETTDREVCELLGRVSSVLS